MLKSVERYLFSFRKGGYERKILEAMSFVDRKDFVDGDFVYEDVALSIGSGQTISQPSTVARMLQLLELKDGDKVLEIGAGSSWVSCLIDYLVGENGSVLGLEIINSLVSLSRRRIRSLGFRNVKILKKDFRKVEGYFDKIIFSAGIFLKQEKFIEDFAREHLISGGILVCPCREGPLIIFRKTNEGIQRSFSKEDYVFVKLVLKD